MGSSRPAPPQIVYSPAAPPPPPPTPVPTQSFQAQTALNEVSGAQSRLNMTLGSQLDQSNKAFFTNEDIRQAQALGGETRLTMGTQGEQERASIGATGEETRKTTVTGAEEGRKTLLQEQMENRYIAQRGRDWAQQAYKA